MKKRGIALLYIYITFCGSGIGKKEKRPRKWSKP
jgi:hypothetical protein